MSLRSRAGGRLAREIIVCDAVNGKELARGNTHDNRFDLNDFLDSLDQMKNMGPMEDLVKMIPGMKLPKNADLRVDEKQIARTEALVLSMTAKERETPEIINPSRKRRIAAGAGMKVEDVNRLLNSFSQMKAMMKKYGGGHKNPARRKKRRK